MKVILAATVGLVLVACVDQKASVSDQLQDARLDTLVARMNALESDMTALEREVAAAP